MQRISRLQKTKELEGIRVVVTGCGYKPLENRFYDVVSGEESHDSLSIEGQEVKSNIGTAVSAVLANSGATVHMVSSSGDKLKNIKNSLESVIGQPCSIEYSSVNLLERENVRSFIHNLPKDKPIYWVQSLGLGAGSYKVANDNPYLKEEDVPLELIDAELGIVKATDMMMKELSPIFRKQKESRIAIVSSMSALRGYSYGAAHCSAKGAIDRYANAMMLGKYKENTFITTVRPGAIDTGMYDSPIVQEAIKDISDEYNGIWRKQITLAPPTSVGEAIKFIFTTPAHIPSLNLVAKGQFPNEGS